MVAVAYYNRTSYLEADEISLVIRHQTEEGFLHTFNYLVLKECSLLSNTYTCSICTMNSEKNKMQNKSARACENEYLLVGSLSIVLATLPFLYAHMAHICKATLPFLF